MIFKPTKHRKKRSPTKIMPPVEATKVKKGRVIEQKTKDESKVSPQPKKPVIKQSKKKAQDTKSNKDPLSGR